MTKPALWIVKSQVRDVPVFFMMKSDDFRFNKNGDYTPIVSGNMTKDKGVHTNGHRFTYFQATDGSKYRIFVDWSAKEDTNK